jgi:hypothetical protein
MKTYICKGIHNEPFREKQEVQSSRWKNAPKETEMKRKFKKKTPFNKNQKQLRKCIVCFLWHIL